MAKVTRCFTLQTTPWENAKLKCSEISTIQNRQIKMQLKYSVLQYAAILANRNTVQEPLYVDIGLKVIVWHKQPSTAVRM